VKRILRIACFTTVYYFIYLLSFIFAIIRTYGATAEGAWYLQHPLEALLKMVLALSRNTIMIFSFILLAFYALIFGFATDLVLSFLKKRIQLRKQRAKSAII